MGDFVAKIKQFGGRILERTEHQGLISHVKSETDKRKIPLSLTDQAHALGIPVFMKEDLVPIIGG